MLFSTKTLVQCLELTTYILMTRSNRNMDKMGQQKYSNAMDTTVINDNGFFMNFWTWDGVQVVPSNITKQGQFKEIDTYIFSHLGRMTFFSGTL